MSGRGDKRFEGKGEAGVLHWQKGVRLYSGSIQAGEVRGSHNVGRYGISSRSRNTAGGQLQE